MQAPAWSVSRARTFQECRRKYYYRYHLAPAARAPEPPREALDADRVKDLLGLEAWAGELVHDVIRHALMCWRTGHVFSEREAEDLALRRLRRQFRDSQAYWDAHPDEFLRRPALLDLHYYRRETGLSRDRAALIREAVLTSLREFLRSRLCDEIRRAGPSRWLPIDRNAAARLPDGLLILVKPDFAYRDGSRLVIVDWKTGKPDPFWETVQVTCYALYAAEKWGQHLEDVFPQIVHLHPEFHASDAACSPEALRDVQLFIRESHEEMWSDASGGLPPPEQFPHTEEPKRCQWCAFRGICDGASRRNAD